MVSHSAQTYNYQPPRNSPPCSELGAIYKSQNVFLLISISFVSRFFCIIHFDMEIEVRHAKLRHSRLKQVSFAFFHINFKVERELPQLNHYLTGCLFLSFVIVAPVQCFIRSKRFFSLPLPLISQSNKQ